MGCLCHLGGILRYFTRGCRHLCNVGNHLIRFIVMADKLARHHLGLVVNRVGRAFDFGGRVCHITNDGLQFIDKEVEGAA